ncbi:MAG: HD domain-containing phosphohydrolase [Actinomycetota bacterium]
MKANPEVAATLGRFTPAREGDEAPKIIVLDDQPSNVRLLEQILARAGYQHVEGITDPAELPDRMATFEPDLILLDLHMPTMDGFAVLEALGVSLSADTYLPILVLTADMSAEAKRRALSLGAKDFLTKPFDVEEVLLRVGNMLETRRLHRQLKRDKLNLESMVRARTLDLEESYLETFQRLALAAEYRDDNTGQHIKRVGRMAAAIGRELGLDEPTVALLELAAGLHDIGKIGVPDSILLKPARLTAKEFEVVKQHTAIGSRILSGSRSPLLRMAEDIAVYHHERWDGEGYAGIAGPQVPLVARITSVADTYDALTNKRPYKDPWPVERALEEIASVRGSQFDPDPVDAFFHVRERLEQVPMGGIAS